MQRKSCVQAAAVLAVLTVALTLAPGAWADGKEKAIYTFKGGKDGALPIGGLIFDGKGNLYGTTAEGGKDCSAIGCGTVFKLAPRSGKAWGKSVLHYFSDSDGAGPQSTLVMDKSGNLYGTTRGGGIPGSCSGVGCGVVFELMPIPGGGWKDVVLHRFAGGNDGAIPDAGVILDNQGNIYGTTTHGGGSSCDCGTVYELSPMAGGGWSETIIHSFSGPDGNAPFNLAFDSAGNLYGVAGYDGAYGVGVAFELSPAAGADGWTLRYTTSRVLPTELYQITA
jgi:uncharacterized repeat protein (TIGR03803 family)